MTLFIMVLYKHHPRLVRFTLRNRYSVTYTPIKVFYLVPYAKYNFCQYHSFA